MRAISVCVVIILATLAPVVPAQDLTDQALTGQNMATVVTRGGQTEDCLAPVAITLIDGEVATVPARGFMLEPGVHSLNGLATLDTNLCPIPSGQEPGPALDLEVTFEAGKTYFVAYEYKSADVQDWKLIVWKVE